MYLPFILEIYLKIEIVIELEILSALNDFNVLLISENPCF